MSPEQVQGERATTASDVFALGAVLYETLTGRRAFEAESLHATLSAVLADDPPPARTLAPGISSAVEDVVHRALGKDPRDRFPDAGAMRSALHVAEPDLAAVRGPSGRLPRVAEAVVDPAAAGRMPTPSTPVSPEIVEAVVRQASRRQYAGLALAALGGAVLGAALWFFLGRAAPEAPSGASAPMTPAAGPANSADEKTLRAQLLESMVELARSSLDNRDYDDAVRRALEALAQDPDSQVAAAILGQARAALAQRERPVPRP
jgi:serine/threonine-protein kinase